MFCPVCPSVFSSACITSLGLYRYSPFWNILGYETVSVFINLLATNKEKQLYVKDILTTFGNICVSINLLSIFEFHLKMSVDILILNRNAIRKK